MSLDPNVKDKTKLVISDVGGKVWEEMNDAGTDYRGADYGYQEYEGPCKRHSSVDCPIPADYQEPFHYYIHRSGSDGGCVAGNAVVPDGIGWPEEYTFLFIDYVYLHIYSLFEDPEHECRDCIPPVSAFRNESFHESIHIPGAHKNEARMLDMFFGYVPMPLKYSAAAGSCSWKPNRALNIFYSSFRNIPAPIWAHKHYMSFGLAASIMCSGFATQELPMILLW